jgi:class 3 adenylate cyclase
MIRTLLITDFVDSTAFVERVGDEPSALFFRRNDRIVRDLLTEHAGQEIDKTDGFLLLFRRPVEAVAFALAYHAALRELSAGLEQEFKARAGIHLGEVVMRRNRAEDIERGAKPVEVEGLAKPMVARMMSLGIGGQTLLSDSAFEMARRAAVGNAALSQEVQWLEHGWYQVKGVEEPFKICEVGQVGHAPLTAPRKSDKAWPVRKNAPGGSGGFGVGLAVVFAIGLGVFAVSGGFEALVRVESAPVQSVAEEPTTVAKTVSVTVVTQPEGALIQWASQEFGTAPVVFSVPALPARLPLVATLDGYSSTDASCVIDSAVLASGAVQCSLKLERLPPLAPRRQTVARSSVPAQTPAPAQEEVAPASSEADPAPVVVERKIDLID